MYLANKANPEPIAIGVVIDTTSGAVQTSGVSIKIIAKDTGESAGGGSISYSADGVVYYKPTQAETNYSSFIAIATKTGCYPASQTVITTTLAVGNVLYSSPVSTSGIIQSPIFIGDDYLASINRAFEFNFVPRSGFVLGTSTCSLGFICDAVASALLKSGTLTNNGDGTWKASYDVSRTDTATLLEQFYRWSASVTNNAGVTVTIAANPRNGLTEVRKRQT